MNKLKLTTAQLEEIFFGDSKRFSIVEKGSWESEDKFETATFVFKDNLTDTYYEGTIGRSGSYWDDYTYDSEWCDDICTLSPIEEKEIVVKSWEVVDEEKIDGEIDMTEEEI